MKLEVGMYARVKELNDVIIVKILEVTACGFKADNNMFFMTSEVIKASHNIIDLIKRNDIILGRDGKIYQVWKIYKNYVFTYTKNKQGLTVTLVDYQIDKILTKEQFESNSYTR